MPNEVQGNKLLSPMFVFLKVPSSIVWLNTLRILFWTYEQPTVVCLSSAVFRQHFTPASNHLEWLNKPILHYFKTRPYDGAVVVPRWVQPHRITGIQFLRLATVVVSVMVVCSVRIHTTWQLHISGGEPIFVPRLSVLQEISYSFLQHRSYLASVLFIPCHI